EPQKQSARSKPKRAVDETSLDPARRCGRIAEQQAWHRESMTATIESLLPPSLSDAKAHRSSIDPYCFQCQPLKTQRSCNVAFIARTHRTARSIGCPVVSVRF